MEDLFELHLGDCLEVMKRIPDNSIDMVLCDPPYEKTAASWDLLIDPKLMWAQLDRIVKPSGAVCIFGVEPFSSILRMSNLKNFKYDWVWKKTEPSNHLNSHKMPLRIYELISVFYRKPPSYYPQKTTGHKRKTALRVCRENRDKIYGSQKGTTNYDSTERFPLDILEYSKKRQTNRLHPSQKPVALLEYLIKTYTKAGQVVLDLSMGSGSTGVACKTLNRIFIGIELVKEFFEIAKRRIYGD